MLGEGVTGVGGAGGNWRYRAWAEVIVDFLNGDPDQPIIMGRTYHEDNRPGRPAGNEDADDHPVKTYKGSGFNELRFEDATSNEQGVYPCPEEHGYGGAQRPDNGCET